MEQYILGKYYVGLTSEDLEVKHGSGIHGNAHVRFHRGG